MINWPVIKSPLNWLTVILMVLIGAFAFNEVLKFAGLGSSCNCNKSLFPVSTSTATN